MDSDRARELLVRERQRIEQELAGLKPEPDSELSHGDQHPGDSGSELFEAERDASIAGALRQELAAVERAEQRLKEGTYGRSVDSGEPIPHARLEVQPAAERTLEEQARFEAEERADAEGA